MHHYIGIVWSPADLKQREIAANLAKRLQSSSIEWVREYAGNSLFVFSRAAAAALHTYHLANSAGVILGTLFSTGADDPRVLPSSTLPGSVTKSIIDSGGLRLQELYWGRYIAFLEDDARARAWVIRDCSGMIPCYRLRHGGLTIFFSDIRDLVSLGITEPGVNWSYIASYIYDSRLQVRETALVGVTELLAGDCVERTSISDTQFCIWNPGSIARDQPIDDRRRALDVLTTETRKCISAWASAFDSVLLNLSGGFDSSVVLGCLVRSTTKPVVQCVNRYAKDVGEDERRYGRLSARMAGVGLLEAPWATESLRFDDRLFQMPPTPKPTVQSMFEFLDLSFRNKLVADCNADSVWSGQGGDHLFLTLRSTAGVGDFLRTRGVRPGLLSAITDSARLSRSCYLQIAKDAVRSLSRRHDRSPETLSGAISPRTRFLLPDALAKNLQDLVMHPWLQDTSTLPLGKRMQIRQLGELLNRHRPIGDELVEDCHPLLSDPLIRASLRIPSYLLLSGGRVRALAREGFREIVPPEILARDDKGRTTRLLLDTLRNATRFAEELIFGGVLARHNIIDTIALEVHIRGRQPILSEQFYPLFSCISAELWLRRWMRHPFTETFAGEPARFA